MIQFRSESLASYNACKSKAESSFFTDSFAVIG